MHLYNIVIYWQNLLPDWWQYFIQCSGLRVNICAHTSGLTSRDWQANWPPTTGLPSAMSLCGTIPFLPGLASAAAYIIVINLGLCYGAGSPPNPLRPQTSPYTCVCVSVIWAKCSACLKPQLPSWYPAHSLSHQLYLEVTSSKLKLLKIPWW